MTGAKDRSAKDEQENPDGYLSPDQNGSGLSRQELQNKWFSKYR
jgi:hypothetical protein